jgi:flagellar hook-associated protein 2
VLNFVEEYNKLMKSLHDMHTTQRPKSSTGDFYMPLTDEERRELSESEVKMWDEKAKEGLLFRDPIIEGLMRNMRMQISNPLTLDNGTRISMSQLGITTSNNNKDGNILVIDMERLDRMIEERPDDVADLFTKSADSSLTGSAKMNNQGVAERLNDLINQTIGASGTLTRKAGSAEWPSMDRHNTLTNELRSQNDRIDNMLTQLQKKEEHYYMMFSKLEAAMMRADQQMASLMGLLGQPMM